MCGGLGLELLAKTRVQPQTYSRSDGVTETRKQKLQPGLPKDGLLRLLGRGYDAKWPLLLSLVEDTPFPGTSIVVDKV